MKSRTMRYLWLLCVMALTLGYAGSAMAATNTTISVGADGNKIYPASGTPDDAITVVGANVTLTDSAGAGLWDFADQSGQHYSYSGASLNINGGDAQTPDSGTYTKGASSLVLHVYEQLYITLGAQTGGSGGSATFSAVLNRPTGANARGVPGHLNSYTYAWQYSTDAGGTWQAIPNNADYVTTPITTSGNKTGETLTLNNLTLSMSGYKFRVNVTDGTTGFSFFTTRSSEVTLTVLEPPSIGGGGADQDIRLIPSASGGGTTVSVTYTAAAGKVASGYTVAWYMVGNATPLVNGPVASGTYQNVEYTMALDTGVPASTTGTASLTVRAPLGSTAKNLYNQKFYCVITETVTGLSVSSPYFIVKQVDVVTVPANTAAISNVSAGDTLSPGIYGGNGGLTYAWYVLTNPGSVPASGQDVCINASIGAAATYSLSSYTTAGTYYFACSVSDASVNAPLGGTSPVYSGVYKLVVAPPAFAIGSLSAYWNNGTTDVAIGSGAYVYVLTGTTVKFRTSVTNPVGNITYTLYRADDTAGTNATIVDTVTNSSNSSVEFSTAITGNYYYYIQATSGTTVTTSKIQQKTAAALQAPTVSYATVIVGGQTLTLTATRQGGTENETVTWYKNGTTSLGSGTSITLQSNEFVTGDWFQAEVTCLNDTFGTTNPRGGNSSNTITVNWALSGGTGTATQVSTAVSVDVTGAATVLPGDLLPGYGVTASGGSGTYSYSWTMSGGGLSAARPVAGTPSNQSSYQVVEDDLEGLDFSGDVPLEVTFTCTINDGTNTVTKDFPLYLFWNRGSNVVVIPENPQGGSSNPLDKTMYEGKTAGIVMCPVSGTAPFSYQWAITYPGGTTYNVSLLPNGTVDYDGLPGNNWEVTGSAYPTLRALNGLSAGTYSIGYTITDSVPNTASYTGTWTVNACPTHGNDPLDTNGTICLDPSSIAAPIDSSYTNCGTAGCILFTADDAAVPVPTDTTRTYQWQISTNGGGSWNNVGNNASTYDLHTAPYAGQNVLVQCLIQDIYHDGDGFVAADNQTATLTSSPLAILGSGGSGGGGDDGSGGGSGGGNGGGNGGALTNVQGVKMYFHTPEPYVIGDTTTVSLITVPAGATISADWSSSNPLVATVSPKAGTAGDGLVKFLKAGTTTITAKITHGGGTLETSIAITVYPTNLNGGTFRIEFPDGFLEADGSLLLLIGEQLNAQLFSNPAGATSYTASGLPGGLTLSSTGVLSGSISAASFCNPCTGSDGVRRQTFNVTISATKDNVTQMRHFNINLEDHTLRAYGTSSGHGHCDASGAGLAALALSLAALFRRKSR